MKTKFNLGMARVLRYAFLALTLGVGLVFLLNLSGYCGLTSDGPFLRGEIATSGLSGPVLQSPLPNDGGEYRIYDFGARKLVLLDFASAQAFFQLRHLAYLLFQNLSWALVVFVLYQMFRIFKNLDRKEPFQAENTQRIRWVAMAVLFYPFASLESELLLKGIVSRLQGHTLGFMPGVLLSEQILLGALLSLVIFALAEVFRQGIHLQQEQDLTI
jgi:hypothetical protein